ncbi:UDP-glucosyltransferase 2-like [Anopheles maculipalpis]|uniref:UDP-glucosyltransferase 2-like n=1 Tax=Anopheles maculipalpis TaxID=1496333 RepID=UPI002158F7CB|nr:UDP-glucosyltransferase 2-like [Anopheles maculipalpis]
MGNLWHFVMIFITCLITLRVATTDSLQLNNILYISAVASPSHFLWSQQLAKLLANQGHNVTLLSIYKEGTEHNLHFLKLDGVEEELSKDQEMDHLSMHSMSALELLASFADLEYMVCKNALSSKQLLSLLNYPKNFTFHLVIHDHLAGPCLLLLLERFDFPPLVMASATNVLSSVEPILGSPLYPGFVPSYLHDTSPTAGYRQRLYNFMLTVYELLFKRFYSNPQIDRLVTSRFQNVSSVSRLETKALMVLMNSIDQLDPTEPHIWRVVNVGGLHITAPKPLRGLFYHRTNKTYDKCVYISFGSNVKINSLTNHLAKSITATARLLPYVMFLWKVDIPTNEIIPENMITSDWFPQNDLLGSGMVDVFVTHGGLLSVQESIWYGIPMLGIPNYGDQYQNVRRMERMGMARRLLLEDVNPDTLQRNLLNVLNDSRYKQSTAAMSQIIREKQITAQMKALWVVEWVIRNHNKTTHMHMLDNLNGIGYMAKYSIDVFSTLIVLICFVMLILYRAAKALACFVLERSSRESKNKME